MEEIIWMHLSIDVSKPLLRNNKITIGTNDGLTMTDSLTSITVADGWDIGIANARNDRFQKRCLSFKASRTISGFVLGLLETRDGRNLH